MMDHNILVPLLSSLVMLVLGPLIIDVISVSKKIGKFLSIALRFLAHDGSVIDSMIMDDDDPPSSRRLLGEGRMTCHDATVVTMRLGLRWRMSGEAAMECQGCDNLMGAAMDELLDRKTASESELKEAFYVFDRNEDGFICAAELWSVMRRLGFKEGRRYEDCMRMIHTFDEDKDGRISYLEFRRMMEGVV
uniref:EF-hand domain-containing protein n=2 Tax=Oryza brachyantha TaxID=4533 RepID=J3MJH6_ORYBR